jgi:hypothetical protein
MFNERQQKIEDVPPASPAVILGLNGAPQAGEKFRVYEDEGKQKKLQTVVLNCCANKVFVLRNTLHWMKLVAVLH